MFLGKSTHTLDEKGRLNLPSKLRSKIDGRMYLNVVPTMEYIELVTEKAHMKMQDFLETFNDFDQDANEMKLFINANTYDIEIDKTGRINIPKEVMETVGISKEVVVTGNGQKISIWDKDAYQAKFESKKPEVAKTMKDIAARLAERAYGKK